MKKTAHTLKFAAIMLLFAGMISSCEKEAIKNIKIKNIEYTGCQNNILSNNEQKNEDKYIKCYAINETTLKFEQRIYLNCCMDSLQIVPNINDRKITINEIDYGNICNCICLSDVCFDVSDLVKNTTYTFVLKRNNQDYYTFEVLFNEDVNLMFNL
jgi:hypothetical protein